MNNVDNIEIRVSPPRAGGRGKGSVGENFFVEPEDRERLRRSEDGGHSVWTGSNLGLMRTQCSPGHVQGPAGGQGLPAQ